MLSQSFLDFEIKHNASGLRMIHQQQLGTYSEDSSVEGNPEMSVLRFPPRQRKQFTYGSDTVVDGVGRTGTYQALLLLRSRRVQTRRDASTNDATERRVKSSATNCRMPDNQKLSWKRLTD